MPAERPSIAATQANRMVPRRVAMLAVHSSPLDQPGGGDAGGMSVYLTEVGAHLARLGVGVEIFTRAVSSTATDTVELAPGVLVRHIPAGPYEPLRRYDLTEQLCSFTVGLLQAEAEHEPGWFDVVHSHYWISAPPGQIVSRRWRIPLLHTAHTLAKAKNASLPQGDSPEPASRIAIEEDVVKHADQLVAATDLEARHLVDWYGATPDKVATISPGVDLDHYCPSDKHVAREKLGLPSTKTILLFVGRLQRLKGPEVLLHATAELVANGAEVLTLIVGGPSGNGIGELARLRSLAQSLDISDVIRFVPPVHRDVLVDYYRAADLLVMPSFSESFGLVAMEAQASGTPVMASSAGGLTVAVQDGVSGLLIDSHNPNDYANSIARLLAQPTLMAALGRGARQHAQQFSWARTAQLLKTAYERSREQYAS